MVRSALLSHRRAQIVLTWVEKIANLADEVYRIDDSGHLIRKPSDPASSATDGMEASSSVETESADSIDAVENASPNTKGTQAVARTQASQDAVERQAAQQMLGDRTVYKTYFKSVGLLHSTIFVIGAIGWAVSFKFSGMLNPVPPCHQT